MKQKYKEILLFGVLIFIIIWFIMVIYAIWGHFSTGDASANGDLPEEVSKEFDQHLMVTFLDVGQGDATFVEFPDGKQLLIDCAIDARVLEALGRAMPFYDRSIDYLLLTHPDKDHYGGCSDVLDRFEVGTVITNSIDSGVGSYEAFEEFVALEGVEVKVVTTTEIMVIDDVVINFLYPDQPISEESMIPGTKNKSKNNSSIVLKLSYGENDILLTGDAEEELERYLVERYGGSLNVEILKAGHHGSDSSSKDFFLEQVQPIHTITSSGKDNKYGHPHEEVIERLEKVGSSIWRTDTDGDIIVRVSRNDIYVYTQKN